MLDGVQFIRCVGPGGFRSAGTSLDARSYSHDVTIICHIRSYFATPFTLSSAFWALSICLALPTA